MSKGIENKVSYQNPKAGKAGMLLGKTGRISGYITAGTGAIGFIATYVAPNLQNNSDIERIFGFLEKNYGPFLIAGGGLVAAGIISGAIGKAQHWWANKTYYK